MFTIDPLQRTLEGWQRAMDAAGVNAVLEGLHPDPELAELDRQLYNLEIQPDEYLAQVASKYAHEGKCP